MPKSLLSRQRAQAGQMRKLLEEPLICEDFQKNGRKGYKNNREVFVLLLPAQLAPLVWRPQREPTRKPKTVAAFQENSRRFED
jgi:hypothetical protein